MKAIDIVNHYGGSANDELANKLLFQWQSNFDRLKSQETGIWKKEPPTIHIFLVQNSTVNAFAAKTNDGYVIAIFDGLRISIAKLFAAILSDARSYPAIGLSWEENESVPEATFSNVSDWLDLALLSTPLDSYRLEFACYMSELALRFAFNHELFHVLLGHVDLTSNAKPLFEIGLRSGDAEYDHAVEMHADERAFQSCVHWILDSLNGEETTDPMTFFMNTIDAQFLDLYAATYTMFQIFNAIKSESHPNPVHRQARLGLILNFLAAEYQISLDRPATKIVGTVINNVDLYMQDILGIDWSSRQKETERILTTDIETEMTQYSKNVCKLYPMLEQHSYIKLE